MRGFKIEAEPKKIVPLEEQSPLQESVPKPTGMESPADTSTSTTAYMKPMVSESLLKPSKPISVSDPLIDSPNQTIPEASTGEDTSPIINNIIERPIQVTDPALLPSIGGAGRASEVEPKKNWLPIILIGSGILFMFIGKIKK